jgi:hypothetical protein
MTRIALIFLPALGSHSTCFKCVRLLVDGRVFYFVHLDTQSPDLRRTSLTSIDSLQIQGVDFKIFYQLYFTPQDSMSSYDLSHYDAHATFGYHPTLIFKRSPYRISKLRLSNIDSTIRV